MQNEIILALEKKGIIFRTRDLNEQGISNYTVSKMLQEGLLTKVYQGVYAIGDIEKLEITDINVIVENGIVSLTSAAYYYQLVDGEDGKITITLNRDQKPPKLPYDLFAYYYTTSKFYDIGLNVIDQNNRKIKIYDRERTVCDIVRHRNKYDSLLIREVIENYLKYENSDVDKLLDYAKELRIYQIMKQYLELLGGL